MNKIFILVLVVFLTSCSTVSTPSKTVNTAINKGVTDEQAFEILHVYQRYSSYFEKVKDVDQTDKEELFQLEIIDPVYDSCFKGGEYLHLVENLTQSVPEEIERYKHLIKSIDQTATEKAIMDALEKSRELLPANHKTTVCIFPSVDRDALPTVTVGSGKITVFYSGFFSLNQLKTAIAHEYHHSYWTERHFNPTDTPTVLDTLVFEGKAVKFEKLVYPEFDFNIIDPVFHKEYWEAIKDDLDSTDVKRAQQIVMGGDEIPSFYGISEGFKIVDHLIKKENLTVEEWTAIPASEALKRGKYEENYK